MRNLGEQSRAEREGQSLREGKKKEEKKKKEERGGRDRIKNEKIIIYITYSNLYLYRLLLHFVKP